MCQVDRVDVDVSGRHNRVDVDVARQGVLCQVDRVDVDVVVCMSGRQGGVYVR